MGLLTDNAFKTETHYELTLWGRWARGNSIRPWQMNVLGRMMQMKMEDTSSPSVDGFPLFIEVIDKAVAELKRENRNEYRTIMKYYLANKTHEEIGFDMGRDRDYIRALHVRAINAVARIKRVVRKRLTAKS